MKILINLISIKSGGGQKVALNFIEQSVKTKTIDDIEFLVTSNTKVHDRLRAIDRFKVVDIGSSFMCRLFFQYYKLPKYIDIFGINIVYTLFGIGINNTKAISVVGSAYSNIYYPEIKFWPTKNIFKYLFYKARDKYRLFSTVHSDYIIFENRAIMQTALSDFNIPKERATFIPVSVSDSDKTKIVREKSGTTNYTGLLLSGYHPNKNIEIIPDVLVELNSTSPKRLNKICLSLDKNDKRVKGVVTKANRLGVIEQIEFLGEISQEDLSATYHNSDYVILLSKLESFSNNIIEAWVYKRPLIISDELWSRAICNDAAVYVPRNDARKIAKAILKLKSDHEYVDRIVTEGLSEIAKYPSPEEKVRIQYEYLTKIFKSNED